MCALPKLNYSRRSKLTIAHRNRKKLARRSQLMQAADVSSNFLGFDYAEFYVGSAAAWEYLHWKAFGFRPVAYSGPETGRKDSVSYVMEQGTMRLVLTASLSGDSEIARHVSRHGDGVKDVAMTVTDVDTVAQTLASNGAILISHPKEEKDDSGYLRRAVIGGYGDTVHSLIDRSQYRGTFRPGYEPLHEDASPVGFVKIDHVVGNVEEGKMDHWVNYYLKNFGFKQLMSFDDKDISTEYSALRSKVVHDGKRRVVMPINEPAKGRKKSQIEEFLDYYRSPGVQHIAIRTENIVNAVSEMRSRGVVFLDTPDSYYEKLSERVGGIDEPIEELRKHRILVDRDDAGYMLQIFTKPVGDRPTFFYEIIERKGGESFGKGNFKALFESIEREQAKRGNL